MEEIEQPSTKAKSSMLLWYIVVAILIVLGALAVYVWYKSNQSSLTVSQSTKGESSMSSQSSSDLRPTLESVYVAYKKTLQDKDYDGYFAITESAKPDGIVPTKDQWLAAVDYLGDANPSLDQTKFITIKQSGDYAGYAIYTDLSNTTHDTVAMLIFHHVGTKWLLNGHAVSSSYLKGKTDQEILTIIKTDSMFLLPNEAGYSTSVSS